MIRTFFIDTFDDQARDDIRDFCLSLEARFAREGMGDTIYNVVQELINNAVKANLKRTFFEKNGFSFDNKESYYAGLAAFKQGLQHTSDADWRSATRQLGFRVTLEVSADERRLLIYVENNALMIAEEERRLRSHLAHAMDVKNLVEFSETYGDDTEGAGLGLALVIMLIKDMGFDPTFFRVFSRGECTVARLEFPMQQDYVPIRRKWAETRAKKGDGPELQP